MAKKPRNPLDFGKPLGHLCPHGNSKIKQKRGSTLCIDSIDQVEVTYSDKPLAPEAKKTIDQLLVRWLTRAYFKKYGKRKEAVNDTKQ